MKTLRNLFCLFLFVLPALGVFSQSNGNTIFIPLEKCDDDYEINDDTESELAMQPEENDYNYYCSLLKEKLQIDFSYPHESIDICQGTPINDVNFGPALTFGQKMEEFPMLTYFEIEFIVRQSKNSQVAVMDLENWNKPKPKEYYSPSKLEYNFPAATGYMLHNCNTPWVDWYIYNTSGVITKDETGKLSEEDAALLQEKVSKLRAEYERCFENNELTRRANCDRIFIVKIPNMDKVTISELSYMDSPETEAKLKSNATECYAVDFFKRSSIFPLRMLFFINGNNTSIDECVADFAEYVKFE